MNRIHLRKFFTALLLAVALLFGTGAGFTSQNALADTGETNEISNFKGDSSTVRQSYHDLQEAAHDFRQAFRDSATGEVPGQQAPLGDRTLSPKQAAKNIGKSTRNAFGRAADTVKDTLDPG